jgi:hypothetical protein
VTQDPNEAIERIQVRRPPPRAAADEQLVLYQQGFGHDNTYSARAHEFGNGGQLEHEDSTGVADFNVGGLGWLGQVTVLAPRLTGRACWFSRAYARPRFARPDPCRSP